MNRCSIYRVFLMPFFLLCGMMTFVHAEEAGKREAPDVDAAHPDRLILHVCEIDGTPIRPLLANIEMRHKFDRQGTPDISPDGKRVAFDAWSTNPKFSNQEGRVLICDIDGTNASAPIDGFMPSFSADGTKIVVSREPKMTKQLGAKGKSIWIFDLETNEAKMIADRGAWGGRWSPDGESILFQGGVDQSGEKIPPTCLRLHDVATGKNRTLLEPDVTPFKQLVHHFGWSPGDSRKVVFGGQFRDIDQSASMTMNVDEGLSTMLLVMVPKDSPRVIDGLSYDWHPDGDSILMTGMVGNRPFPVVVSTTVEPSAMRFPGIPTNVLVRDPIFTNDGQQLIAAFGYAGR